MKYAIMSDAHANPDALLAALDDAKRHGAEKVIYLGDVTGYGYDPIRTLDILRERADVCLMGNHDVACAVVDDVSDVVKNRNYHIDIAQRKELGEERLKWLSERPYTWTPPGPNPAFACVHGTFVHPEDFGYMFEASDADASLAVRRETVLFVGHTHLTSVFEQRPFGKCEEAEPESFKLRRACRYVVNVGSVGYPRNEQRTNYAIFDEAERTVIIRSIPFDFTGYVSKVLSSGRRLPGWLLVVLAEALDKATGRVSK